MLSFKDEDNAKSVPASADKQPLVTKPSVKRKGAGRKRKSGNEHKPKRPLSAYNYFFKAERERIIEAVAAMEEAKKKGIDLDMDKLKGGMKDFEDDPLSFRALGKRIAERWKNLSPEELESYKKLADEDTVRYKKEMEVYRKEEEERRKAEKLAMRKLKEAAKKAAKLQAQQTAQVQAQQKRSQKSMVVSGDGMGHQVMQGRGGAGGPYGGYVGPRGMDGVGRMGNMDGGSMGMGMGMGGGHMGMAGGNMMDRGGYNQQQFGNRGGGIYNEGMVDERGPTGAGLQVGEQGMNNGQGRGTIGELMQQGGGGGNFEYRGGGVDPQMRGGGGGGQFIEEGISNQGGSIMQGGGNAFDGNPGYNQITTYHANSGNPMPTYGNIGTTYMSQSIPFGSTIQGIPLGNQQVGYAPMAMYGGGNEQIVYEHVNPGMGMNDHFQQGPAGSQQEIYVVHQGGPPPGVGGNMGGGGGPMQGGPMQQMQGGGMGSGNMQGGPMQQMQGGGMGGGPMQGGPMQQMHFGGEGDGPPQMQVGGGGAPGAGDQY